MLEKRKFNRWYTNKKKEVLISGADIKGKKVEILDIGAGGMKVSLPHPLETGTVIRGKFEILPHLGTFFVKGEVTRVKEKEKQWEIVIKFKKISTAELEE